MLLAGDYLATAYVHLCSASTVAVQQACLHHLNRVQYALRAEAKLGQRWAV